MEYEEDYLDDLDIGDVSNDPISELIDNIENKDYTAAQDIFNSLLNDKLKDAIEGKKIAIASSIYGAEETEEEFDYEEV